MMNIFDNDIITKTLKDFEVKDTIDLYGVPTKEYTIIPLEHDKSNYCNFNRSDNSFNLYIDGENIAITMDNIKEMSEKYNLKYSDGSNGSKVFFSNEEKQEFIRECIPYKVSQDSFACTVFYHNEKEVTEIYGLQEEKTIGSYIYSSAHKINLTVFVSSSAFIRGEYHNVVTKHILSYNIALHALTYVRKRGCGSKALYKMIHDKKPNIVNYTNEYNLPYVFNCTMGFHTGIKPYKLFLEAMGNHFHETYGKEYTYFENDYKGLAERASELPGRRLGFSSVEICDANLPRLFATMKRYNFSNINVVLFVNHLRNSCFYNDGKYYAAFREHKNYTMKDIADKYNINSACLIHMLCVTLAYDNSSPNNFIIKNAKYLSRSGAITLVNLFGKSSCRNMELSTAGTFVKDYINANSEKKFLNQFAKIFIGTEENRLFCDTVNSYDYLYKKDKTVASNINLKDSIENIHNVVSLELTKISEKNHELKYKTLSDEYKEELNALSFDGIKYHLAKDTNELKSTGLIMGICVGSYRESALKERCYILIGYSGTTPVTCIELNKYDEKMSVSQVKGKYNHRVTEEERCYLIDNFEKLEINHKTCHDLKESCDFLAIA